ncbi:MAG: RNA polymerase sigma factor [Acidimicrobiia bacterium]
MTVNSADEFGEWVSPHLGAMGLLATRLVGSAEGDDLVQDALTRAWRKREQFDAARGTPRAWLLAIVADRARRSWRRPRPPVPPTRKELVSGPDGLRVDVERAIAALPARMRLAVECVYVVDLTIAETAQVMGISDGTVKSTLSHARDRLRLMLEES